MCERVAVGAPSPQQSSARIGGGCICSSSSSDGTEEIVFNSLMKIRREEKKGNYLEMQMIKLFVLCFLTLL